MTRTVRTLLLLVLLPLLLVGCGPKNSSQAGGDTDPADPAGTSADAAPIDESCPTSNTISFAKTKFVLHTGLAFGAFHRYLYKPYKAGTFKKGADGRITAIIKGGLAALFVKREIRLASADVKANPTLCKAIAAPLGKLGDTVQAAFDKLKGGDPSGIEDANGAISSIESTSSKDGVAITENENADLTSTPS
jgi:hypothetical protein